MRKRSKKSSVTGRTKRKAGQVQAPTGEEVDQAFSMLTSRVSWRRSSALGAIFAMFIALLCGGALSLSGAWATGVRGEANAKHEQKKRELMRRPELKTHGGKDSRTEGKKYIVLEEYPHDQEAFTQGLSFHGGYLYESTGLKGGKSSVRRVEVTSGAVLADARLENKYFGEGMTILNNEITSLTWREKKGFVWDLDTLTRKGEFSFRTKTGEGWGITTDGNQLIISDGSSTLFFWDPVTKEELRRVDVQLPGGTSLRNINELEYVHDHILANVWFNDAIFKINADTGKVVEIYNFDELYPKKLRKKELKSGEACLNGIAWDPEEDVLYLTGKLWPRTYKVKLLA